MFLTNYPREIERFKRFGLAGIIVENSVKLGEPEAQTPTTFILKDEDSSIFTRMKIITWNTKVIDYIKECEECFVVIEGLYLSWNYDSRNFIPKLFRRKFPTHVSGGLSQRMAVAEFHNRHNFRFYLYQQTRSSE